MRPASGFPASASAPARRGRARGPRGRPPPEEGGSRRAPPALRRPNEKSPGERRSSSASRTARSTAFFSSRTLPGHAYDSRTRIASPVTPATFFRNSARNCSRKWFTEERDVPGALAERRERDGDDAEAVVEVLAEAPRRDGLLEIPVRRRDDAHVDVEVARPADPPEGLLLEEAQELGLERRRHLADLVEEDRAAVGRARGARASGCLASVNAPRSCPKSSLSSSVSGSAEQVMFWKMPDSRSLAKWITLAARSLPVPLSPTRRTVDAGRPQPSGAAP